MTLEAFKQLKGTSVQFRVRDIYLPEPSVVLSELHADNELTGTVVDLSDDARDGGAAFVVVEVAGLREPCIVAVKNTHPPGPVDGEGS